MKNSLTKSIVEHLEFLWFNVEDWNSEDEEIDIIHTSHESYSNISFRVFDDNTILFNSKYNFFENNMSITNEFLEALNTVNKSSRFTKWYYREVEENKVLLCIESWIFTFEYNRQKFGSIIITYEDEIKKYLKEFKKFQ